MPKAPPEQERQQPMFTCFPEQRPEKGGPRECIYVLISLISGKRSQQKERLSSNQERRKKVEQVLP